VLNEILEYHMVRAYALLYNITIGRGKSKFMWHLIIRVLSGRLYKESFKMCLIL